MPWDKNKDHDCFDDWAVYDETIHMTGDDTFYFLGSCDKCGQLLEIHCRIENDKMKVHINHDNE